VAKGARQTAIAPEGTVVFLIGMRINRWHKPWKWMPVAAAMPRMLAELGRQPELGLLSARTFVSGRTILVVQYWRSFDAVNRYARDRSLAHLPAWRAFNRRVGGNGDVGVFHETYVLGARGGESVYVNMPAFGLGAATGLAPVASRGESAAHRLDTGRPDDPAVEPAYH
jgi:Domain of unknown function (DUF4188)